MTAGKQTLSGLLTLVQLEGLLVHVFILLALDEIRLFGHDDFDVARRTHVGYIKPDRSILLSPGHHCVVPTIDAAMSTVGTTTLLGRLVDLDVLDRQLVYVQPLDLCPQEETVAHLSMASIPADRKSHHTSALLWTFLSRSRMNRQLFSGQRPCVVPKALAWAVRPTPPLKRRNGTHCLCWRTLSRYCTALRSFMPAIAAAVSRVFYSQKGNPFRNTVQTIGLDGLGKHLP